MRASAPSSLNALTMSAVFGALAAALRLNLRGALAAAPLTLAVLGGCVQNARADVRIEEAVIVRPLAPGQAASGYVDIRNTAARADRLMSATSARAARIVLHEMVMDGDMMRMRDLHAGFDIPPNRLTSLADAGVHLMISEISGSIETGDKIPVVLHFARAGDVSVAFTVVARPPATSHASPESHQSHQGHH